MEEHSFTSTLAIKFLCFISFLFVLLNILELEKIYFTWVNSIAIYQENDLAYLDSCIKFPLLSKTFFSLFSLFFSISAVLFTLIVSINIDFFLEKCLLTFIYYNFYLFGPYLLFSSLFAITNFDKVFNHCRTAAKATDYFSKTTKASSLIQKQNEVYNFFSNDIDENNNHTIRIDRIFSNNNYVSVSNIFNLVTTITVSFLLCLSMTLYETFVIYQCSILRKDGGNPIIGKLFWFLISKNRMLRINRRDPVANNNNALSANPNNILIDISHNSGDLINNSNEETSLLVRDE